MRPAESVLADILRELQQEVGAEDVIPFPLSAPRNAWRGPNFPPGRFDSLIAGTSRFISGWLTAVRDLWHRIAFGEEKAPRR